MQRLALALGLGLVLTTFGCAAAHEANDVGSGIYELMVRNEGDACAPSRVTGAMGAVGIVSHSDVLDVAVPDGLADRIGRVSLARSNGFATEVSIAIDGCAGARLARSWSVLDAAEDRFSIAYAEEWSGITGCEGARAAMPAAPRADCRAERTLEYTLTSRCAAPCSVRLSSTGPSCSCD